MSDHLDSDSARLELNAKGHRHDPGLDRIADMLDAGDYAAWSKLPPAVLSQAEVYRDFRDHHRAAVKAGVIRDTQTPKETP